MSNLSSSSSASLTFDKFFEILVSWNLARLFECVTNSPFFVINNKNADFSEEKEPKNIKKTDLDLKELLLLSSSSFSSETVMRLRSLVLMFNKSQSEIMTLDFIEHIFTLSLSNNNNNNNNDHHYSIDITLKSLILFLIYIRMCYYNEYFKYNPLIPKNINIKYKKNQDDFFYFLSTRLPNICTFKSDKNLCIAFSEHKCRIQSPRKFASQLNQLIQFNQYMYSLNKSKNMIKLKNEYILLQNMIDFSNKNKKNKNEKWKLIQKFINLNYNNNNNNNNNSRIMYFYMHRTLLFIFQYLTLYYSDNGNDNNNNNNNISDLEIISIFKFIDFCFNIAIHSKSVKNLILCFIIASHLSLIHNRDHNHNRYYQIQMSFLKEIQNNDFFYSSPSSSSENSDFMFKNDEMCFLIDTCLYYLHCCLLYFLMPSNSISISDFIAIIYKLIHLMNHNHNNRNNHNDDVLLPDYWLYTHVSFQIESDILFSVFHLISDLRDLLINKLQKSEDFKKMGEYIINRTNGCFSNKRRASSSSSLLSSQCIHACIFIAFISDPSSLNDRTTQNLVFRWLFLTYSIYVRDLSFNQMISIRESKKNDALSNNDPYPPIHKIALLFLFAFNLKSFQTTLTLITNEIDVDIETQCNVCNFLFCLSLASIRTFNNMVISKTDDFIIRETVKRIIQIMNIQIESTSISISIPKKKKKKKNLNKLESFHMHLISNLWHLICEDTLILAELHLQIPELYLSICYHSWLLLFDFYFHSWVIQRGYIESTVPLLLCFMYCEPIAHSHVIRHKLIRELESFANEHPEEIIFKILERKKKKKKLIKKKEKLIIKSKNVRDTLFLYFVSGWMEHISRKPKILIDIIKPKWDDIVIHSENVDHRVLHELLMCYTRAMQYKMLKWSVIDADPNFCSRFVCTIISRHFLSSSMSTSSVDWIALRNCIIVTALPQLSQVSIINQFICNVSNALLQKAVTSNEMQSQSVFSSITRLFVIILCDICSLDYSSTFNQVLNDASKLVECMHCKQAMTTRSKTQIMKVWSDGIANCKNLAKKEILLKWFWRISQVRRQSRIKSKL